MIKGYSDRTRPLTPRMVDVLEAAAAGATLSQTARALGVTEGTVSTIRAALCARLGVPNIQAATYRLGRGELH